MAYHIAAQLDASYLHIPNEHPNYVLNPLDKSEKIRIRKLSDEWSLYTTDLAHIIWKGNKNLINTFIKRRDTYCNVTDKLHVGVKRIPPMTDDWVCVVDIVPDMFSKWCHSKSQLARDQLDAFFKTNPLWKAIQEFPQRKRKMDEKLRIEQHIDSLATIFKRNSTVIDELDFDEKHKKIIDFIIKNF